MSRPPPAAAGPYAPPAPGFRRCFCGCLVLWDARTGEDRTPLLGETHRCGINCQCRLTTREENAP